jgi:hypothetical protein
MPKPKFYAVAVGREGPKVYGTWDEVNIMNFLQRLSEIFTV